jgi:glycosyltransferase involved in cell wall biosynthesis
VWGGGEKWHIGTAFMMKERNFDVTVFAQPGSELISRTRKAGISSFGIKVTNMSFLNPLKVMRLARIFRKLHTQVIILNLPSDVKFAGIAARLAGVKKIIYRRGSPVPVRNSMMNRFLFRHVLTHIIANSDQIKRNILQNNPKLVNNQKITIIYNGIDRSLPMPDHALQELTTHTHGVIIGTAGRLSQEKGQEWLINMAADLKEKGLDFTLLIAGEGPIKDTLEQKCKDLDLTDYIHFGGFIAEMDKFYSIINLFVLTSAWEGCSNVILEAMHQGLPVVAFNNSSIPEMVQNNVNGYLVRNEDGKELVEKVEILIRDPHLRVKLGEAGKQIVSEKYNLNNSYDQLTALIQNK